MPIKKSAKKYMGVTDRKTVRNKKIRGTYRSAIKKTREAVGEKDLKKANEWLKKTIQTLDKAIEKKIIKKNTGSRYKSRINKMVKNLSVK